MGIERDLSVSDLLSYRYPEEVGMKRTASLARPLALTTIFSLSLHYLSITTHPPMSLCHSHRSRPYSATSFFL